MAERHRLTCPPGALAALSLLGIAAACLPDFGELSSGGVGGSGGDGGSGPGGDGGTAGSLTGGTAGVGGTSGGVGGDGGTTSSNLFVNGDFENGASFWTPIGGCTTELTTVNPHSPTRCLRTSNRTEDWEGPSHLVTGRVEPGRSYQVRVWARLEAGAEAGARSLTVTFKNRCSEAGAADVYTQLGTTPVTTDWTELGAAFTTPDCVLAEGLIYVEGAPAGESFCIDDASLELLP